MKDSADRHHIEVESIVGTTTGLPLVRIKLNPPEQFWRAEEAIRQAWDILEAAVSAEVDLFMFEWFKRERGLAVAGKALLDWREFRRQRERELGEQRHLDER